MRERLLWASLAWLLATPLAGCNRAESAVDVSSSEYRQRYLLAEEPANPLTVLDAQETAAEQEIVLVGLIGGVEEPWSPGQAAFVIVDPTALMDDDHQCTGCAFCKDNTSPMSGRALIQFVDEQGKVLPLDARRLFDLSLQQMVVVRGRASQNSLGILVVSADGLYIRR